MSNYIDEMLSESPQDFSGTALTPAAKHLFDTNEFTTLLSEKIAATFHHIVEKSLFLAKRARPYIQLAVSFICTRVRCCDEHYCVKARAHDLIPRQDLRALTHAGVQRRTRGQVVGRRHLCGNTRHAQPNRSGNHTRKGSSV